MLNASLSANQTPLPIVHASQELPEAFNEVRRALQNALNLPGHPGKDRPEALVAYCLQLLGEQPFQNGSSRLRNAHEQLKLFIKKQPRPLLEVGPTGLHALLYPALEISWRVETAAPWLRNEWSMQKPGLGQQMATALVLQGMIGGKLFVMNRSHPETERVWNLLEADGGSLEADLTQRQPADLPKEQVNFLSPDMLQREHPWTLEAVKQLKATLKDALLAYAFAAYTIKSPR